MCPSTSQQLNTNISWLTTLESTSIYYEGNIQIEEGTSSYELAWIWLIQTKLIGYPIKRFSLQSEKLYAIPILKVVHIPEYLLQSRLFSTWKLRYTSHWAKLFRSQICYQAKINRKHKFFIYSSWKILRHYNNENLKKIKVRYYYLSVWIIITNNSVALVRERTVPTERPPLAGEDSANVCWLRVSRGQRGGSLLHNLGSIDRSRYSFFQVSSKLYSLGWVDPTPEAPLLRKSGRAGNRFRTSGLAARNPDH
jgi:hypothetical protein